MPNKLIISTLHIKGNEKYKDILSDVACSEILEDETTLLMLFIMDEHKKGSKSKFWPYLKLLTRIEDLSDFGADYIKETEEPLLAEYLQNREEDVIKYWKDFETIGKLFYNDPNYYSKELVKYAWKILQTRSFGYNVFPGTSIIPIIDFLNHGLEEKLVFAVWPKRVEINMLKRSILLLKNDTAQQSNSEYIKNGDEHFEEIEYSNYTETSKPKETHLTGKPIPILEDIWDIRNNDIFLELRSQKNRP